MCLRKVLCTRALQIVRMFFNHSIQNPPFGRPGPMIRPGPNRRPPLVPRNVFPNKRPPAQLQIKLFPPNYFVTTTDNNFSFQSCFPLGTEIRLTHHFFLAIGGCFSLFGIGRPPIFPCPLQVLDEVKSNNKIILVIDEIHTLVGAGAAEGAVQGSNFLFPQCTPFPQTLSILATGGGG